MHTDTHQPHYRKTKSGTWAVCGPASVVLPGADVTVHKKDGSTKTERIVSVGKTFTRDGVEMVYGYPAERQYRRNASYGWGESCGARCPVNGHICTPSHPCHDCY